MKNAFLFAFIMVFAGLGAQQNLSYQKPSEEILELVDGKKAQNRTYQDLLQNKNDEHNFEQLALIAAAGIILVELLNQERKLWIYTPCPDSARQNEIACYFQAQKPENRAKNNAFTAKGEFFCVQKLAFHGRIITFGHN